MSLFYTGLIIIAHLFVTEPGPPMGVIPVISTDGL